MSKPNYSRKKSSRQHKTKKRVHRGGAITRNNFNRRNIVSDYISYVRLLEQNLIPQLVINGARCNGTTEHTRLIARGSNGFGIRFQCGDGNNYVAKLFFNIFQAGQAGNLTNARLLIIKKTAEEEFDAIAKINSPYVMKAYAYFLFNPNAVKMEGIRLGAFEVFSNGHEKVQHIDVGDVNTKPNYLISYEVNRTFVPSFSGIIMESIQHSFRELPHTTAPHMRILRDVFVQYMKGIQAFIRLYLTHTDIKPDNLMYNKDGEVYTAKIIDIGAIQNVTSSSFQASTPEYMPPETALLASLVRRQTRVTQDEYLQKFKILARYDLYCLAKSFINEFGADIEGLHPEFHALLTRCMHADFNERPDIPTAIAAANALAF